MKFHYIAILSFIFHFNLPGNAQTDSAFIQVHYNNSPLKIYSKYYITLPDSLKNGEYIRYNLWQKIEAQGNYLNGKKQGVWVYYDDLVELIMTIDHSTEDLVFLNLSSNTDPVYLKDEVQLPNYIRTKIPEQFTKEELKQLNGKLYYVIIKLNDEGKIIEAETLNQKSKKGATVFDEKLSKLFLNAPRCLVVQPTEHMINSFTIPIKF